MINEELIIGAETKYPLNGLLTIPKEINKIIPAVVLVHGSGPSNMDAQIGNNYPFKDLAEGLSEKGIAVLRYDKRTLVYGQEMKSDAALSVREETIEDAILAADLLRKDTRIDANKIFVIGHSLGGMLAPRIDAEGGDFSGIIIMGGSPRKFEEILMDQNLNVVYSLNKFMKMITRRQIMTYSAKFYNIHNMSDEEAKQTTVLGKNTKAYYFKEMGKYPAIDYLSVMDKPVYILQGAKDFHISVEKDYGGYQQALGDQPNVTFKLYKNLNHVFMPSVYGSIKKSKQEYKVAQHVDEQVIEDLADWIYSV